MVEILLNALIFGQKLDLLNLLVWFSVFLSLYR
jgi:hypothetical protein